MNPINYLNPLTLHRNLWCFFFVLSSSLVKYYTQNVSLKFLCWNKNSDRPLEFCGQRKLYKFPLATQNILLCRVGEGGNVEFSVLLLTVENMSITVHNTFYCTMVVASLYRYLSTS